MASGKEPREYRRHSAVPEGMKYCAHCNEIKAVSEFGRNRSDPSGHTTYCKPCHNRVMAQLKAKKDSSVRNYHLKRRYDLTEDEVAALRDRHADRCLICLRRCPLHVDHDHQTGAVRGLLCFRCNGGLGQFRDDPHVMRRAVDYLEGRILVPYCPAPRERRRSSEKRTRRDYHLTQRYGIRDNSWVLRRAIEYLTGGLSGLRRTESGGYGVTVVRPRSGKSEVDAGWELGQACTDDLALLDALAQGDSGEPWETEADLASGEAYEPRFPILDLSEPVVDEALPGEPLGPPEYAVR